MITYLQYVNAWIGSFGRLVTIESVRLVEVHVAFADCRPGADRRIK